MHLNIILVCIIAHCCCADALSHYRAPVIDPRNETVVINAGEHFNLTCTSMREPFWSYATQFQANDSVSYKTDALKDNASSFRYRSTLMIREADYKLTGFIYCNDSEDSSANIYLFVRDPDHLTTLDMFYTAMTAVDSTDVILPCRPTSPEISVQLFKHSEPAQEIGVYFQKVKLGSDEGFMVQYSSKVGFILTREDLDALWPDTFSCVFYGDTNITVVLHLYPVLSGFGGSAHVIPDTDNSIQTSNFFQNTEFDKKYGFLLKSVKIYDSGDYQCIFNDLEEVGIFLHVLPSTTSVSKPNLEDSSDGHTLVGTELKLNCSVVTSAVPVDFFWETSLPTGLKGSRITKTAPQSYRHNDQDWAYTSLIIRDVTKGDEGNYTCKVKDFNKNENSATIFAPIHQRNASFVHLYEENNLAEIEQEAGVNITIRVNINAHPLRDLHLSWYKKDALIGAWNYTHKYLMPIKSFKYSIDFSATETTLEIYSTTIEDSGNYTLIANNNATKDEKTFQVDLADKPVVSLKMDEIYSYGLAKEIQCIAIGNPRPRIYWKWDCSPEEEENCQFPKMGISRLIRGYQVISTLNISAVLSGNLSCIANNSEGMDMKRKPFYVTDVANGFGISLSANCIPTADLNTKLIPQHEIAHLTCEGSRYMMRNHFEWFLNGTRLTDDEHYVIERSSSKYSFKSIVKMKAPKTGDYKCVVLKLPSKSSDAGEMSSSVRLIVSPLEAPRIVKTNLGSDLHVEYPAELKLECAVYGIPWPEISWLHNDHEIFLDNRTSMQDNGQVLHIKKTAPTDDGKYACQVRNSQGVIRKEINVIVDNKQFSTQLLWIAITILSATVLIVGCYACWQAKVRRECKEELKRMGLQNFEEGDVNKINPDQGLTEQAWWLPFNKSKWEFPFDKLKLGKQLGSGAFGVVMKGDAYGILPHEACTIVAVKTIKPDAEDMYLKALAIELKIMAQIGQHLNVVNLLGACTNNMRRRELYVIVEYCRYGNLQTYLLKHRRYFVNQIDERTGLLDYNVGPESMDRSFSFSSRRSSLPSPTRSLKTIKYPTLNTHSELDTEFSGQSNRTETPLLTPSPHEDTLTSNASTEGPVWRLHYRGDYTDEQQLLYTKDLLIWAFQVARGMEYLVNRKVLHRDLAARNILLAENNIVKICDFGLAKETLEYVKQGDTPLPIKWMAVESIQDKVFSTQSDIWSYGVVLWELFSLAKSPYPGMTIDDDFLLKIIKGYRMEIPTYATNQIYNIMLECWDHDPKLRPSFTNLAERFGTILGESVKQYYIDLNDPYLVANTKVIETDTDYLQMFAQPDFETVTSTSEYRNDSQPITIPLNPQGYMCMKSNASPSAIFSPRPDAQQENVFKYDMNAKRGLELMPMLNSHRQSSSEASTPVEVDNCVTNPGYLNFSMHTFHPNANHYQNVNIMDNYIHMQQNKMNKFSGKVPIVQEAGSKKDHDDDDDDEKINNEPKYINATTRDWEKVSA